MTVSLRARWLGAALLLLLVAAGVSCSPSSAASQSVTVVLFDVSNSTQPSDVRARYDETFGLVLAQLRGEGGVLGADIIDSSPLVHGDLPINETFSTCTLADNSLDCRKALDEQEQRVRDEASSILSHASRGTDVFGALELARQFFAAYPGAGERTLVICSDMVQSANGMHLGAVESWSETDITRLLAEAPDADLAGVHVYVVGAGATTLVDTTPEQIDGIRRFWTRWFEDQGASIDFYGANLARFPIPTS